MLSLFLTNNDMAKDTKNKILNTALNLFVEKGVENVNMQEIADYTGIGRTAVNYHFETKELLYDSVLKLTIKKFFPPIYILLRTSFTLDKKIKLFISKYIDNLSEYPYLPLFMARVLNNDNEDIVSNMLKEYQLELQPFYSHIEKEIKAGNIQEINPFHVLLHMIALCTYPITAKPLIQITSDIDDSVYEQTLSERKKEVTKFVLNGLKP